MITNLLFLISVTQLFHELDFAIKKRGDILKACTKNRIFFLLPDKIAKRFLSFSFLSRCAQRAGFNLLGRDSGECIRQDLRCLSLYCSKLYTGSVVDLSLFGKNLKIFHFSSGEIQNSNTRGINLSIFPIFQSREMRPRRIYARLVNSYGFAPIFVQHLRQIHPFRRRPSTFSLFFSLKKEAARV